jgi:hypothetical protein
MAAVSKDKDHNESCGGKTLYETDDGAVVFYHRGPAFANYSQLEFECIVQLQPKTSSNMNCNKNRGRKPRPGFELGSDHLLYAVGVIRTKMCTPMLAGAPPPSFPGNRPFPNGILT